MEIAAYFLDGTCHSKIYWQPEYFLLLPVVKGNKYVKSEEVVCHIVSMLSSGFTTAIWICDL